MENGGSSPWFSQCAGLPFTGSAVHRLPFTGAQRDPDPTEWTPTEWEAAEISWDILEIMGYLGYPGISRDIT